MLEAIMICALSLPSGWFTRPRIVSYHMAESQEKKLVDWLKKNHEIEEIFIHESPQEELLKKSGWQRLPFLWNGKQVWGKYKPRKDQKMIETSA